MSPLSEKMAAIEIDGKGGPEVLRETQCEIPKPGPGQVLIKVAAAGVNRPDIMQRKGLYPAPKGHSTLPGLEVAGEVVARGPAAEKFNTGAEVMALVNGGGYAQFCVADEGACLARPQNLSMIEAAALPETFFTVWHNVFERGALKPSEWLLVHGGSSGIGVTAIQLAKAFGAHVVTTAGSKGKCDTCVDLGADVAVNYREDDFVDAVKSATSKRGVDVILDMVGGDYVDRNIKSLAEDGRLVNIGFQNGSRVDVDLMRVMLKRLTLTGSTLRVRSSAVKAGIARAIENKVLPLIERGDVRIVIDKTFALAEAGQAHAHMENGQHIGKIVLTV